MENSFAIQRAYLYCRPPPRYAVQMKFQLHCRAAAFFMTRSAPNKGAVIVRRRPHSFCQVSTHTQCGKYAARVEVGQNIRSLCFTAESQALV